MKKIIVNLKSSVIDSTYEDSIISVEYSENTLDSMLSNEPGICEQYANIKLKDNNSVLRNLALNSDLEYYDTDITIYEKETTDDTSILENTYKVYDWNIDFIKGEVSIDARDTSYKFNDITISLGELTDRTVADLIIEVFNKANISNYTFEDGVQNYCNDIKLNNCWYKENTLYNLLQDISNVALLRIYWYHNSFMIGKVVL